MKCVHEVQIKPKLYPLLLKEIFHNQHNSPETETIPGHTQCKI